MKDVIQKIYDYTLEEIMGERFGRYSKYIIQDRAIPDVRDGLKPVQRRILFSMYKQKWTYDKPYQKSARVIGDVMGKYHPHGDSSIYEAMVRMSQPWKLRAVLIDMQGNNGSIDGDNAAASRYTEARLSKISDELLRDLNRNTVLMTLNYDDKLEEPTVLPARFPNLLVNGATGISAGYATNIPPHNLGEIIDATIALINNKELSTKDIIKIVKGPDFPTGGIVEGIDGIKEAYETGRGKIIIKSKVDVVKAKGKEQLVITEISYEVNKANLVKRIDDIRINKKIDGIADVRDESDKEGLRIAIDLKKDADSNLVLNYLLKNTELQITYNFNMVSIVNRRPKLLGIIDILKAYIEHQKEVIRNRTEFDLEHARKRFHIVEGLVKALSILDDVIKTIRASKNKTDAEDNLVSKFDFTREQAEAIVTLQLYRLTNTDVVSLEEELKNLTIMIKGLNKILEDESVLMKVIVDELTKIKEEYNTPRLTEIKKEVTEIKIDTTDLIAKDDVIVVVTNDGYVKRVSTRSYNANEGETLLKEGDYVIGLYSMTTLDTLLIFTDLGNYLYVPVYELPDAKWKDLGKHISNIIGIKAEENIIESIPVIDFDEERYITIFTKLGMVKRTKLSEFKVQRYSKPMMAMKLKTNDKVVSVSFKNDPNVLITTHNCYALLYNTEEIPISGTRATGVKAISLKNDYVVSGTLFDNEEHITVITDKGSGKRIRISELEKTSRARKGVLVVRNVKTNPYHIVKSFVVDNKSQIGIKIDKIIILKISEITIMDRYSTGSNIYKGSIKDAFVVRTLEEPNVVITEEEHPSLKQMSLLDVDDNLRQIDDVLHNFNDEISK